MRSGSQGIDYRIGLDPFLTLLPIAGDAVAAVISLYVVFEGWRAGASPGAVAAMLGIAIVDILIGFIPVVGALLDTFWKANSWNVWIIERSS
jgi:hypothetical protein